MTTTHPTCPGCSGRLSAKPIDPRIPRVFACRRCGGIVGDCYLGDSYRFVLPRMTAEDVPADRLRYFDLTCLGSAGRTRRHGWFDPETRLVVQAG